MPVTPPPYNDMFLSPAQRIVVQALLSKTYGRAIQNITPYAAGEPVNAGTFNQRLEQVEGLLAYLEDRDREEFGRARLAEDALAAAFGKAFKALVGTHWIAEEFTGTAEALPDNPMQARVVLTAGLALVQGKLLYSPWANYPVYFSRGLNQELVINTDGILAVQPAGYTTGSEEMIVGHWADSSGQLAYTAVETDLGGGDLEANFIGSIAVGGDIHLEGDMHLGDDDQDISFEHAATIPVDTRNLVTTFRWDGLAERIDELDPLDGTVVKSTSFSYDPAGNITSVTIVAGGKTAIHTYSYSANGTLSGVTKIVN